MKSILTATFFFTLFSLQAENTVSVPSKNCDIDLQPELEYFLDHDKKETIESIPQKEFTSFKDVYFPNAFQQKIWFRIRLKNEGTKPQELLFNIRAYAFIRDLKIYEEKDGAYHQIFIHNTFVNRKFSTPIKLSKESTYYFEVQFSWVSLLKIQLVSPKVNQENLLTYNTWQGVYYGFSFLIIFLNLFFFFSNRNPFFLYYCFFQLGVIMSIAYLDNYIFNFFGNSQFTRSFEGIYNLMISFGGVLFVDHALNLRKHFPFFTKISYALLVISAVLFFKHSIIGGTNMFGTATMINLFILLFGYLTSIYYSKRLSYARFIVAGFTVLFVAHLLYSLPVLYGYKENGFYEWHYKIASVIEMLIFMAAIPYRHKKLINEKISLENRYSEQQKKHEVQLKELEPQDIEDKIKMFSELYQFKKREVEISRILITGATNKGISEQLFISLDTVKHYCSSIYKKTEVKNRSQFITLFNTYKVV